jgi:nitrogen fixation NifU-like protein
VKGKTLSQALEIKNTEIAEELALPRSRSTARSLAEDAIKAAVADYRSKHGSTETETPICTPVAP